VSPLHHFSTCYASAKDGQQTAWRASGSAAGREGSFVDGIVLIVVMKFLKSTIVQPHVSLAD